jgi:hypothetical protein
MKPITERVLEPVIRLGDYLLPERYDPSIPLEWEQTGKPSIKYRSGRIRYRLEPSLLGVSDTMRPCLFWLIFAHRRYCDGKSLVTGHATFQRLNEFVAFLGREDIKVCDISDITATLLYRYRESLRSERRCGRNDMARHLWSAAVQMLKILSQHPNGIVTDMLILHEGLGTISAGHANLRKTERVLSREELGTVIAACRTVISSYRETWMAARSAICIARDAGYAGERDPNWESYGEVLLWLEKKYRSGRCGDRRVHYRLDCHVCGTREMYHRRFGCVSRDDIYGRIIPPYPVVFAYFLHVCVYLAANPQPLGETRQIDCIEQEVAGGDSQLHELVAALGERRESVVWNKGRSNRLQRRTFEKDRPWSPPVLIRELIEMTASLRERAPEQFCRNVFLTDQQRRRVCPFSLDHWKSVVSVWRSSGVKLPEFSLRDLRKSSLNQGYVLAKGNIGLVKSIANHVSAETTHQNYLRGPARRLNDDLIARLVRLMTQRFTMQEASTTLEELPTQNTAGAKMVETLLSAFCNPRFVYCGDVERIARLLQLNDALTRARSSLALERWAAIYAPLQHLILEEVLPKVKEEVKHEAREICPHLPPLAPIE